MSSVYACSGKDVLRVVILFLGPPIGRSIDVELPLCGFVSLYVARVRVDRTFACGKYRVICLFGCVHVTVFCAAHV